MRHALAAFLLILLATGALAAVETTTIQGKVYTAGGAAATGGSITCTLSDSGSTADGASSARVASRVVLTIEADGDASGQMVPNDAITPSGTYYTCRFSVTGPISSSWTEKWQVDTTPDPVAIGSITRLEVAPGLTVGDYLEYVSAEPSGACLTSESPKQALDTGTTCSCVASSWSCVGGGGGTPGGNSGEVQLNIGGSFAGDTGLTFDGTANALTVAGGILSPNYYSATGTSSTINFKSNAALNFFAEYDLSGTSYQTNFDLDSDSTTDLLLEQDAEGWPRLRFRGGGGTGSQYGRVDSDGILRLGADRNNDGTGEAIEFDVDGDETAEMGLGRTQLLPDAADGPKYPSWDLDLDGTKDLFWDDVRGIVRPDGTPWNVRGLPVISFQFDRHNNDATDDLVEWQRCNTAGIPCGFAAQNRSQEAGFGYQASDFATARQYGVQIGTHTNSHCVLGWPDTDYMPELSNQYGLFRTQTDVTVTADGISSTVVGSGFPSATYEFSDNCLGRDMDADGTLEYGNIPIGGHFVMDSDGDGTLEFDGSDFESYVTAVPVQGSHPADEITLAAVPPACTNCVFQVYTGPREWKNDYATTAANIEADIGDSDFKVKWFGGPGYLTQDFQPSMVNGFGGLDGGSGSYFAYKNVDSSGRGNGITMMSMPAGAAFDVSAERMLVSCGYDYTSIKDLIDIAVDAKRSLYFNGHPNASTTAAACSEAAGFGDSWNIDILTNVYNYCRTLMAQGKAICADPATAFKLQKMEGDSQAVGVNLLANPDFELLDLTLDADGDGTSVAWSSGYYPSRRWPWFDMDSDGTYDAHINDTTTDEWAPDATLSGFGEMDWDATNRITTITRGANTDTRDFSQVVRLRTGYYQTSLWVTTAGFATSGSVGLRTCINLLPRIAGNGNAYALSPRWSVYLEGDSLGLCSDYVRGSRERVIRGDFYVPPELDGAIVEYVVQWTGAGTTIQMRDASLMRYYPAATDSRLGGANIVPRRIFSGHPVNESGYAYYLDWHPNDKASGQASASQTAGALAVEATLDGTAQVKVAIDSAWRLATDGCVSLGDADTPGSATCICRETTDRVWVDEDCDGTRDSNEQVIPERIGRFRDYYEGFDGDAAPNTAYQRGTGLARYTGYSDADPLTGTACGGCYQLANAASAGTDGQIGCGPFLNTNSTDQFYSTTKMVEFRARLHNYRIGSITDNTSKRTLVGAYRTSGADDFTTKTDGIYFWCNPDADVDGDGTIGDANADGDCLDAGDDLDECQWYTVVMGTATDNPTLVGATGTTATKTGVSCISEDLDVFEIKRSGDMVTFAIYDEVGGTTKYSATVSDANVPTSSEKVAAYGLVAESTTTKSARLVVDWCGSRIRE